MSTKRSGYKELPHTADWQMHVWAEDLPSLFVEAARGMNALTGVVPTLGVRKTRKFETEALDYESLLVTFLSELIWTAEQEHLVFDEFNISFAEFKLKVEMSGTSIQSQNKSIKAVTYHNLQIREQHGSYQVNIVFDV